VYTAKDKYQGFQVWQFENLASCQCKQHSPEPVQHSLNVQSLKLVSVEEKQCSMGQHLTACMHLVYFLFITVV
jgi:hypothetical protein